MNFKLAIYQLFFFPSIFQAWLLQCLIQVKYAKKIPQTIKEKIMK